MEMRKQSRFRERLDDCLVLVGTRAKIFSALGGCYDFPKTEEIDLLFNKFYALFEITVTIYTKKCTLKPTENKVKH